MQKILDALGDGLSSVASWLMIAVLSGGLWVVRRVFTNQQQLREDKIANEARFDALMKHLESRDEMRLRDREDLQEVKRDVKTLTQHMLTGGKQ